MNKNQWNNMKIIETALLNVMYPHLLAKQRKQLHDLLSKKKVVLFDIEEAYRKSDDILCSIIRHNDTNYEQLVQHTEKYKARAILGPTINESLRLAKCGKTTVVNIVLNTGTPVKIIDNWQPDSTQYKTVVVGHVPPVDTRFAIKKHSACLSNCATDITGRVFGDYRVVGLSATIAKQWVCQCECGVFDLRKAKSTDQPVYCTHKTLDTIPPHV